MRIRTIKPEFYANEQIAELHPLTRILFTGLWGLSDVRGRLEDRPKRIKVSVLPYDEHDVDKALSDLHRAGFIRRYSVKGVRLIQVINFEKHQRISGKEAETESVFPGASEADTEVSPGKQPGSAGEAPGKQLGSQEGKGREGIGMEGTPKPPEGGVGLVDHSDPLEVPEPLKTQPFMKAWAQWQTYRRGKGKVKDWVLLFQNQLEELSRYDADTATRMLKQSMFQGWTGIFPPKDANNTQRSLGNGTARHRAELADNTREALNRDESDPLPEE